MAVSFIGEFGRRDRVVISFTSRQFKTGEIIEIDIIDPNGTKVVSAVVMTEISDGFYKFIFGGTDTFGRYLVKMTQTSGTTQIETSEFEVIDRQSEKVNTYRGAGGIIRQRIFTKKEKDELFEILKLLGDRLKKIEESVGEEPKSIPNITKEIETLRDRITEIKITNEEVSNKIDKIPTKKPTEEGKVIKREVDSLKEELDKIKDVLNDIDEKYIKAMDTEEIEKELEAIDDESEDTSE